MQKYNVEVLTHDGDSLILTTHADNPDQAKSNVLQYPGVKEVSETNIVNMYVSNGKQLAMKYGLVRNNSYGRRKRHYNPVI